MVPVILFKLIGNNLKNIKGNTIIILLQGDWREGIQWTGNQRILRRKRQLYGLLINLKYIFHGDARNLSFIKNSSIDFVCTHPPYENIIKYSSNIDGDISLQKNEVFWESMRKVALESYRVLRSGKYCAIMKWQNRSNKFLLLAHEYIFVFYK